MVNVSVEDRACAASVELGVPGFTLWAVFWHHPDCVLVSLGVQHSTFFFQRVDGKDTIFCVNCSPFQRVILALAAAATILQVFPDCLDKSVILQRNQALQRMELMISQEIWILCSVSSLKNSEILIKNIFIQPLENCRY